MFGVQKKLARASLALNGIIKTRQLHLSKSVKEFEGLDIEGIGTGPNGVSVTSGKEVYIIRCAIRHFISPETASIWRAARTPAMPSSMIRLSPSMPAVLTCRGLPISHPSRTARSSPIRVSRCGRMAPATSSASRLAYSTAAGGDQLAERRDSCLGRTSSLIQGAGTFNSTIPFR